MLLNTYMYSLGYSLNSGRYRLIYSPLGSNLLPNDTGQLTRDESKSFSKAEDDTHIQFPAQTEKSASSKYLKKCWSPFSQLSHRAPRVRKLKNCKELLINLKPNSKQKLSTRRCADPNNRIALCR